MVPHGTLNNHETTDTYKIHSSHVPTCPGCQAYRLALQDAIEILLKSKSAFKSKTLGALRQRLQQVLNSSP
jgi:hypothetical protein